MVVVHPVAHGDHVLEADDVLLIESELGVDAPSLAVGALGLAVVAWLVGAGGIRAARPRPKAWRGLWSELSMEMVLCWPGPFGFEGRAIRQPAIWVRS